jgi:eukaryotic-like serine/threonine-protein kinase
MNAATGLDIDALPADVQQRLADVLDSYLASLERGESASADTPAVASLLREHPEIAEPLKKHLESLRLLIRATTPHTLPASPQQVAPSELGDFLLVKEIGRGGMGVVYEALQRSLGRRVALKVLPFAAVLEPKQIARFQHEAQAAAQLHHPHIVPVFGVGCERGVHYYSMQLVEGRSLEQAIRELRQQENGLEYRENENTADWSPDRKLSQQAHEIEAHPSPTTSPAALVPTVKNGAGAPTVRDRNYYRHTAELMAQAAEALHFAHENGIVHRDIKPSNLLLDNAGKLWVTDFGLARMASDANLTVTGDILGTVRYMSPEQAAGQNHLIDHRTDIYSLGTTLYELLTLRPLHDGVDRPAILRRIESHDTPQARKWNRDIPHDLETILLKSLSKERDQRYDTAQAFADDLRNFLAGRSPIAQRPSVSDRITRWAMRHRRAVLVSLLSLLLALGGTIPIAFMLMSANHRTQEALTKSNNNYQQAREIVHRFLTQQARRLGEIPGTEPLQKELLQDTLAYYNEFIQQAMHDPPLRSELADAYFYAGEAAEKLGDKPAAAANYTQAVKLLTDLLAEHDSPHSRGQLANSLNNLGLLQWEQGEKSAAEEALRESVRNYEACALALADQPRYRDRWTTSLANLAMIQAQQGHGPEAGRLYQTAISIQEQLISEHPREIEFRRGLAVMLNNVSHWRRKIDPAAAIEFCTLSLSTQQEMVRLSPDDDAARFDLSLTYNNLGSLRGDQHAYDDAAKAHLEAIAIQEQLTRKRPGVVRYRRDVAISYNNLGHIRNLQRQPEQALVAFRQARGQLQQLTADFPHDATFQAVLAGVWNNEGLALEKAEQPSEALAAFTEAIRIQSILFSGSTEMPLVQEALNQHYRHLLRVAAETADERAWLRGVQEWPALLKTNGATGKELLLAAADIASAASQLEKESTSHHAAEIRTRQAKSLQLLEISAEMGGIQKSDMEEFSEFGSLKDTSRFLELLSRLK